MDDGYRVMIVGDAANLYAGEKLLATAPVARLGDVAEIEFSVGPPKEPGGPDRPVDPFAVGGTQGIHFYHADLAPFVLPGMPDVGPPCWFARDRLEVVALDRAEALRDVLRSWQPADGCSNEGVSTIADGDNVRFRVAVGLPCGRYILEFVLSGSLLLDPFFLRHPGGVAEWHRRCDAMVARHLSSRGRQGPAVAEAAEPPRKIKFREWT